MLDQRSLLESPTLRLTTVGCPGDSSWRPGSSLSPESLWGSGSSLSSGSSLGSGSSLSPGSSWGSGSSWSPEEQVTTSAVVLVRRGVFLRRVNGVAAVADTTTGYVQRPGECQQVAHPAGGDVCTTIGVPPELADRLSHAGPLVVPPAADLAHRRLLSAARAGHTDLPDLADLAAEVLAALLPPTRPPGSHARVDDVRTALHTDPGLALDDLARLTGWSPWHLSRTFHRVTGVTIGTYRRRLRVRAALDALTDGDSLASIAARTGFADQAHMTRALGREIDLPPAAARRLLSA